MYVYYGTKKNQKFLFCKKAEKSQKCFARLKRELF